MASITIHSLETDLDLRLTEEARRAKKSKNQLVKELLSRSLGLRTDDSFADDYREFCGLWNREEYETFLASQLDNSRIDDEDWRS
jgi:hypothetical protein